MNIEEDVLYFSTIDLLTFDRHVTTFQEINWRQIDEEHIWTTARLRKVRKRETREKIENLEGDNINSFHIKVVFYYKA